jgi:Bacterial Ig-like domain (group 2)
VNKAIAVTPTLFLADGTEYELPIIALGASATATVDVRTALAAAPAEVASHLSDYGSIRLRYTGSELALLAQTALGSNTLSESFVSRFNSITSGSPVTQTLEGLWWARDNGIGGFVALSNASTTPKAVTVQALTATGQVQPSQSLTLPANSTRMLDLMSLIGQQPNAGDAGGLRIQFDGLMGEVNVTAGLENRQEGYSAVIPFWQAPMAGMEAPKSGTTLAYPGIMLTLSVTHAGNVNDVMCTAGSVDAKGTYVFEVDGRAVEQGASKESPYWSVKNGNDTMVALWNPSGNVEDVMVTLKYAKGSGKYHFRVQSAPFATANLDLKEIIANQTRDEDGNTLPLDLQEGSFVFHNAKAVHAPLSLAVNVGIFNVVKGTCYYGTVTCAGYYGSLIVSPSTFSLAADGEVQEIVAYGQYSDGSTPGVFSSSNTSVASVSGNGVGYVTAGNQAGNATITATSNLPAEGSYSGYNPSCASLQPYYNYTGTATAKVGDTTPVITGMDPNEWQASSTTTVIFTGQGFGTNAPTVTFSPNPGINYTLSSYNDTQIVANISTPNWGGVVNVTVTSNGYNGQGFQSNGNGQSAQSAPMNAGIHQTSNNTEITVIGWLNGSAITLPSGANASLTYDLTHSATCAVDVGFWALGSGCDIQASTSSADVAYANAFLLKYSGE